MPARTSAAVRVRAEAGGAESDVEDENVIAYCSLDESGRRMSKKLSLADKERMFLDALAGYYYNKVPSLSDEEFELLKDELVWEGSKVAVLSPDELCFLEARLAYSRGAPIMSDAEYDALKEAVRTRGTVAEPEDYAPRCTLGKPGQRGQQRGPASVDLPKMMVLYLPSTLAVVGGLFAVDLFSGFGLAHLATDLPLSWSVALMGGLVLPLVYLLSNTIAELMFTDGLVLRGSCPNCGEINTTFFGDILTVTGSRDENTVTCPCCEAKLKFNAPQRQVLVAENPNPVPAKA